MAITMSSILLHSVLILAGYSCFLTALPLLPVLPLPGVTLAKLQGAVADLKLRGAIKKLSLGDTKKSALTPITNTTENRHQYEPTKYKKDEYMGWVHWLQHVPTATKVRGLTQGFVRRLAHSFFNHDSNSLKGLTPRLDAFHNVINSVGKMVLPTPQVLDHFDTDVPHVFHPESHLVQKLRTRTDKLTSTIKQRLAKLDLNKDTTEQQ